jgi:acid phosphatase family membrane protein YuiD
MIILLICFAAWAVAQGTKFVIGRIREKRFSWSYFVSTGGMPSSHSATVTALATGLGMSYGFNSAYFDISAILAVIVMYDAAGVRQSVGQHSVFLNRLVKELSFKTTRLEREQDFREFIGHTPVQVFVGAVLGILITWLWIFIDRL